MEILVSHNEILEFTSPDTHQAHVLSYTDSCVVFFALKTNYDEKVKLKDNITNRLRKFQSLDSANNFLFELGYYSFCVKNEWPTVD